VELLYPVSAVVINTLFLHTPLTNMQLGAGAVLLFAVTMISVNRS
jgi:drug/metabolite transporter (DMT)-like permease